MRARSSSMSGTQRKRLSSSSVDSRLQLSPRGMRSRSNSITSSKHFFDKLKGLGVSGARRRAQSDGAEEKVLYTEILFARLSREDRREAPMMQRRSWSLGNLQDGAVPPRDILQRRRSTEVEPLDVQSGDIIVVLRREVKRFTSLGFCNGVVGEFSRKKAVFVTSVDKEVPSGARPADWLALWDSLAALHFGGLRWVLSALCATQHATAARSVVECMRLPQRPDVEIMALFRAFIDEELDESPSHTTFFRSNTIRSKVFSEFSRQVGADYLLSVTRPLLSHVDTLTEEELNDAAQVQRSTDLLLGVLSRSVERMPPQLRELAAMLDDMGMAHYEGATTSALMGGFLVLRFLSPALSADVSGTKAHRKHLINVTKVLQACVNGQPLKGSALVDIEVGPGIALLDEYFAAVKGNDVAPSAPAENGRFVLADESQLNPGLMRSFWADCLALVPKLGALCVGKPAAHPNCIYLSSLLRALSGQDLVRK